MRVRLVGEGTHPVTKGGVGTRSDLLIRGLPERDFSVPELTAGRRAAPAYDLPPNVSTSVSADMRGPIPAPKAPYVFADPSGRRWRRSRRAIVAAGTVLVIVCATIVGLALQPTAHSPAVHQLTLQEVGDEPPVVGHGPMIRILRIERSGKTAIGIEPVSGTSVGPLSAEETLKAGDAQYVIQRFGYAPGTAHTISLTFDDGPDPVWTPALLNLLSKHQVQATFFVVGENLAKHPEFTERAFREGHAVAPHSMTHMNISQASDLQARFELRVTERALRSVTGVSTGYMRMPYVGVSDYEIPDELKGLIKVQNDGYVMAGEDFDTHDWYYAEHPEPGGMALPALDGSNYTILMHDAGGSSREQTLAYVERLITKAKAKGYTFKTLPQAQPVLNNAVLAGAPSAADKAAMAMSKAMFVWPAEALKFLFWLTAISVVSLAIVFGVLALLGKRRRNRVVYPDDYRITVSAVVAAYNEEMVIGRTIESILDSKYPITEIVIVDDGSKDRTREIVREWAARDPRVRLISQPNAGKSAAMNNGIRQAVGEAVFTLDADTIVTSDTVGKLVRHFGVDNTGKLAAVGMVIRVGNRCKNLITRWQALEYVAQIGLERAAQDYLNAITIIPGACAVWRRDAILAAGGFSHDTLAEDNDLTLAMLAMGYRVTLDYEAEAFTEAPETVNALLAQRTRWTYGNIQALFKHRNLLFRKKHGWLGCFVLPWQLAQIIIPLVTIPLVWMFLILTLMSHGIVTLLVFFSAFTLFHLAMAAYSVIYLKEKPSLLLMVPVYRLIFDPLRTYLLYVSVLRALRGVREDWNKLERTGSMDASALGIPETTLPQHTPLVPIPA